MKFAAFSYSYSTNLGDEIQTLSATQFLPRVDHLIERDRLHWYRESEPAFVIFNGWFIQQPFWPPPESLSPLFVSFHAARPEALISQTSASYFKRHEPIGCRSMATVDAFRKFGVKAYFSGCLTLTLQRRDVESTDHTYVVDLDPVFEDLIPDVIRRNAIRISHEFPTAEVPLLQRARWNAAELSLRGIQKWDRARPVLGGTAKKLNEVRHTFRSTKAQDLLATYSSAKLVLTSRLHCALPCLAMGTPVILLRQGIESDPRFAGLRDFVRYHSNPSLPIAIDWQNPEPNSDSHLSYANALRQRCEEAVSQALASKNGRRAEAGNSAVAVPYVG